MGRPFGPLVVTAVDAFGNLLSAGDLPLRVVARALRRAATGTEAAEAPQEPGGGTGGAEAAAVAGGTGGGTDGGMGGGVGGGTGGGMGGGVGGGEQLSRAPTQRQPVRQPGGECGPAGQWVEDEPQVTCRQP